MSPAIIALIGAIVQGLPEVEAAIAAIVKMSQGTQLTPEDMQALGAAMVAAHNRVQAG